MIVIAVVALLVFGPRKLPELGRQMGKALAEFRRASMEIRRVVNEEIEELERESRDVTREGQVVVTPPQEPAGSGSIAPPGLERSLEKPAEEKPSDGAPEKA
jgi:TatA/E family protein of Tat protein translocase